MQEFKEYLDKREEVENQLIQYVEKFSSDLEKQHDNVKAQLKRLHQLEAKGKKVGCI